MGYVIPRSPRVFYHSIGTKRPAAAGTSHSRPRILPKLSIPFIDDLDMEWLQSEFWFEAGEIFLGFAACPHPQFLGCPPPSHLSSASVIQWRSLGRGPRSSATLHWQVQLPFASPLFEYDIQESWHLSFL